MSLVHQNGQYILSGYNVNNGFEDEDLIENLEPSVLNPEDGIFDLTPYGALHYYGQVGQEYIDEDITP